MTETMEHMTLEERAACLVRTLKDERAFQSVCAKEHGWVDERDGDPVSYLYLRLQEQKNLTSNSQVLLMSAHDTLNSASMLGTVVIIVSLVLGFGLGWYFHG